MKKAILALVVLVSIVTPAMAGPPPRYWGRNTHGSFLPQRSVVVARPVYCAPRPIYVAPRPMFYAPRPVYYRPTYYSSPVVYQSAPVVYQPAPVVYTTPAPQSAMTQPAVIQLQFPAGFVESGRRYHSHGSDVGTIDWVKGKIGDRKVEITFNADGTRREIEDD